MSDHFKEANRYTELSDSNYNGKYQKILFLNLEFSFLSNVFLVISSHYFHQKIS
jgi:hypothetical protein